MFNAPTFYRRFVADCLPNRSQSVLIETDNVWNVFLFYQRSVVEMSYYFTYSIRSIIAINCLLTFALQLLTRYQCIVDSSFNHQSLNGVFWRRFIKPLQKFFVFASDCPFCRRRKIFVLEFQAWINQCAKGWRPIELLTRGVNLSPGLGVLNSFPFVLITLPYHRPTHCWSKSGVSGTHCWRFRTRWIS